MNETVKTVFLVFVWPYVFALVVLVVVLGGVTLVEAHHEPDKPIPEPLPGEIFYDYVQRLNGSNHTIGEVLYVFDEAPYRTVLSVKPANAPEPEPLPPIPFQLRAGPNGRECWLQQPDGTWRMQE